MEGRSRGSMMAGLLRREDRRSLRGGGCRLRTSAIGRWDHGGSERGGVGDADDERHHDDYDLKA